MTQPNHLTLGELIERLRAEPNQAKRVKLGLAEPHSYRGDYHDLAFEPTANTTVAEMLTAAEAALGATYQGYKGGDFTMREYTDTWLANYGECGETIGALLLDRLLADEADAEPDDLDRLIADSMRDPEFARAFFDGQERERQAAYERGVAEGRRQAITALARTLGHDLVPDTPNVADEDLEPWFRAALQTANDAGRRQATEGWEREWAVRLRDGSQLKPDGEVYIRARARAEGANGTVVSRVVGPWEQAEQAKAAPTCCPGRDAHADDCPEYRAYLAHLNIPAQAERTCRHCGHVIVRNARTSTGWTHGDRHGDSEDGCWVGVRCPGALTGAEPVGQGGGER